MTTHPIAVVAAAALFPGSQDARGFWRDITLGRDLITDVPASHWRLEDYYDPDPYGPAVLYVYRTVRNPKAPGGAEFVPELVHNWSGAGSDLLAVDLNKDGATDIVTSTKFGTFIFWGKPGAFRAAAK